MKDAKKRIIEKIKSFILSAKVLPLVLVFTLTGFLFVMFRMKSLELDYKISGVNKEIKAKILDNKELKAKKAKLLSVKNLRRMASKFKFSEPNQEQIIVIH